MTCRKGQEPTRDASGHRNETEALAARYTPEQYLHADRQPCLMLAHRTSWLASTAPETNLIRWARREDAVAMDAVAMDAVAMDAVAMDAVAMDAVAMDAEVSQLRQLHGEGAHGAGRAG
jgi:hypothetical protein